MNDIYILGIESSCDDTSAAVLKNGVLLSNVTASQAVHEAYGGVVPELASRAHQQNVVPVVDQALARAGVGKEQLSAVAFTRGPGLMGSLLVGVNFAKGFARALGIPLIDVNHLQGHVMAHFIDSGEGDFNPPPYPFLCLLVSGGNSQIVKVNAYNDMEVLGQTIDDAAGEAIDKCSKVMGLGYPGGPIIDRLARQGNPKAYTFAEPSIPGLDYSFSGLKTSFLYSLQKWVAEEPDFIENHKEDIAASLEWTIVDIFIPTITLYHGTDLNAAKAITGSAKRNISLWNNWLSGTFKASDINNAWGGMGVYFASSRQVVISYSQRAITRTGGVPVFMACRVSLGKIINYGLAPQWVASNTGGNGNPVVLNRYAEENGYTTAEWWNGTAAIGSTACLTGRTVTTTLGAYDPSMSLTYIPTGLST